MNKCKQAKKTKTYLPIFVQNTLQKTFIFIMLKERFFVFVSKIEEESQDCDFLSIMIDRKTYPQFSLLPRLTESVYLKKKMLSVSLSSSHICFPINYFNEL